MITEFDKLSVKRITFFMVKTFLTQSISEALRSISGITLYLTGGVEGAVFVQADWQVSSLTHWLL